MPVREGRGGVLLLFFGMHPSSAVILINPAMAFHAKHRKTIYFSGLFYISSKGPDFCAKANG